MALTQSCETMMYFLELYNQTEQDCNKVVSDAHLDSISHCCCAGGTWKSLATHLEIQRAVIEDVDRKQIDDKEKRSLFFCQWKQMKGSEATYMKLLTTLLKIQRRLDAEEVLKLLQSSTATISQPQQSTLSSPTTSGSI